MHKLTFAPIVSGVADRRVTGRIKQNINVMHFADCHFTNTLIYNITATNQIR